MLVAAMAVAAMAAAARRERQVDTGRERAGGGGKATWRSLAESAETMTAAEMTDLFPEPEISKR